MELLFSGLSPYVRKVSIVAHEHGLADRLRLTKVNTRSEPEKITPYNALAKIPVLITDQGVALSDSTVICEYLDAEFGDCRLLPRSGPRRWEILTICALADGLLDAALLARLERARLASEQSADWIALQLGKVNRGLDRLEQIVDACGSDLDMAQVGMGAAAGYIPLRLPDFEGLPKWPKLKAWYESQLRRPSFASTVPVIQ
jgi:glutathione S-transferase